MGLPAQQQRPHPCPCALATAQGCVGPCATAPRPPPPAAAPPLPPYPAALAALPLPGRRGDQSVAAAPPGARLRTRRSALKIRMDAPQHPPLGSVDACPGDASAAVWATLQPRQVEPQPRPPAAPHRPPRLSAAAAPQAAAARSSSAAMGAQAAQLATPPPSQQLQIPAVRPAAAAAPREAPPAAATPPQPPPRLPRAFRSADQAAARPSAHPGRDAGGCSDCAGCWLATEGLPAAAAAATGSPGAETSDMSTSPMGAGTSSCPTVPACTGWPRTAGAISPPSMPAALPASGASPGALNAMSAAEVTASRVLWPKAAAPPGPAASGTDTSAAADAPLAGPAASGTGTSAGCAADAPLAGPAAPIPAAATGTDSAGGGGGGPSASAATRQGLAAASSGGGDGTSACSTSAGAAVTFASAGGGGGAAPSGGGGGGSAPRGGGGSGSAPRGGGGGGTAPSGGGGGGTAPRGGGGGTAPSAGGGGGSACRGGGGGVPPSGGGEGGAAASASRAGGRSTSSRNGGRPSALSSNSACSSCSQELLSSFSMRFTTPPNVLTYLRGMRRVRGLRLMAARVRAPCSMRQACTVHACMVAPFMRRACNRMGSPTRQNVLPDVQHVSPRPRREYATRRTLGSQELTGAHTAAGYAACLRRRRQSRQTGRQAGGCASSPHTRCSARC
eukprot:350572-Chlamydomonas_euryale.AAC.1